MSNFLKKDSPTATETLSQKPCAPCTSKTQPIEGSRLEELMAQLHGWELADGKRMISKTYKFADWSGAADFVNQVALLADRENHHPDIHLSWGKVQIALSTHKINGLSENDFILASKIDQMQEGADLE